MLRPPALYDPDRESALLTKLSNYHHNLGDFVAAFEYNQRAGEALDRAGLTSTAARLTVLNNEAVDLANFGEFAAAVPVLAAIIERLDARGDDIGRWFIEANYGAALAHVGRTEDALATFERAIEQSRASKYEASELRARFFRARTLIRAGRLDEGVADLDFVENAYRRDPVKNRGFLLGVGHVRAEWLTHSRRFDEAAQFVDALLEEAGDSRNEAPTWLLNSVLPLASEIALAQGDATRARAFAERAVQTTSASARSVERSAEVGRAQLALGRAHLALNDAAAARAALAAAVPGLRNGLGPEHAWTREAERLLAGL